MEIRSKLREQWKRLTDDERAPWELECRSNASGATNSDSSGNDCPRAIATPPHAAPSDPLDRAHNQIYAVGDEHKVWKVTATDPGGRWRPAPETWRRAHRDPLNEYVAKRPPVQLHTDLEIGHPLSRSNALAFFIPRPGRTQACLTLFQGQTH